MKLGPFLPAITITAALALATSAGSPRPRVEKADSAATPTDASPPRHASMTNGGRAEADRICGVAEPVPGRRLELSPYSNWPLFQLCVVEGQRVSRGDVIWIQYETPLELAAKKQAVEAAGASLEAARVRESNAAQKAARVASLARRAAGSDEDHQQAANTLRLAAAEARRADALLRMAEDEAGVADFVNGLNWMRVPPSFGSGVVTKINVSVGAVPRRESGASSWVEVIDPSVLQVRVPLRPERADGLRPGREARVVKGPRSWHAVVQSIGIAVDPATGRVPVLLTVENHDESLRCYSSVDVEFTDEGMAVAPGR